MATYNDCRWEAEKNIKFINEYKLKECLWDPNHALYKHRDARETAYKDIMAAMNMMSVQEVVTRIRVLRNTLNNELSKEKKLQKVNGKSYKSKIRWLPHLDFIKNLDIKEKTENERLVPRNAQNLPSSNLKTCAEEAVNSAASDDHQDYPSQAKKIKRDKVDLFKAVESLEKVIIDKSQSNFERDEFDLFGQTVAQQLRQLPLAAALETEEMVLAVIRKQRIKIANPPSPEERPDDIIVKVEEVSVEALLFETCQQNG